MNTTEQISAMRAYSSISFLIIGLRPTGEDNIEDKQNNISRERRPRIMEVVEPRLNCVRERNMTNLPHHLTPPR